jgi:FkbM family methyltransferase
MMPKIKIPFSKTVKKFPESGLKKGFYLFLATVLQFIHYTFYTFKRFPKGVVKVKLCTGDIMLLYPRRTGAYSGIHRDLFLYRVREPYSTAYLTVAKILQRGDVVLDIGANIGYYALIEARIVGEKGCVYAVESVKQNVMFLKTNIALNGYNNVQIFQMALGDHDGKTEIHVGEACNLSAIRKDPMLKYVDKQEVSITTVDAFLIDKRKPKLIRMDVEGYEYEILKGMQKTLKQLNPLFLFIELHNSVLGDKKLKEVLDILKSNGFKVQFVAIYPAIMEHVVITKLLRKAGAQRLRAYKTSFEQLKKLCKANGLRTLFAKGEKSNEKLVY